VHDQAESAFPPESGLFSRHSGTGAKANFGRGMLSSASPRRAQNLRSASVMLAHYLVCSSECSCAQRPAACSRGPPWRSKTNEQRLGSLDPYGRSNRFDLYSDPKFLSWLQARQDSSEPAEGYHSFYRGSENEGVLSVCVARGHRVGAGLCSSSSQLRLFGFIHRHRLFLRGSCAGSRTKGAQPRSME